MSNKTCNTCSKQLTQKIRSRGELEAIQQFKARKFCDRACSAKYSSKIHKGKSYHNKGFQLGNKYGIVNGAKTRFKNGHRPSPNRVAPSGENHYNWKGGITTVNEKLRKSHSYKIWRQAVFLRDGYCCIWCNSTKNIEADHIKPFSIFNNLRFEVSNGRTLCKECHKKTDTYAGKVRNYVQSS